MRGGSVPKQRQSSTPYNSFFNEQKQNQQLDYRASTNQNSRRNSGFFNSITPKNGIRNKEFIYESGKRTPTYYTAKTQASEFTAYSPNAQMHNPSKISTRLKTSGGISTESTFYAESPTMRTSSPFNNRFYNTNQSMLSRNSNTTQQSNKASSNYSQPNVYYQYDPYEKCGYYPRSPKYSFASASRSTHTDKMQIWGQTIPGPGQYDNNKSMLSGLGGTMMSKYADRSLMESARTPSPASYNQDDFGQRRHSPSAVMGTTKQNTTESFITNSNPSPLDYKKENCQVVYQRSFRATIGTAGMRRTADHKANTPGPSSYNIPLSWLTGPAQTIAQSGRDQSPQMPSPSPASYNPNIDVVKTQAFRVTIGNAARDSPDLKLYKTNYSPGPTDYEIFNRNYRRSPKAVFPLAKKNTRIELSPGPGDYNIPLIFASVPRYLTKN